MDIKNNRTIYWQALVALMLIFGICIIPIKTADIAQEENPDDATAQQLSSASSITFNLEHISPNTVGIALWTNDSVRAPDTTQVHITIEPSTTIDTTLGEILKNEREITISLQAISEPLRVRIDTPTLETTKAILLRTQQENHSALAYTTFVEKPLIVALIHKLYQQQAIASDIQYVWNEGSEILHGKNPYARAAIDTKHGSKYATYFPLSYIASAAIQKIGFAEFADWLKVVRPIVLGSQLASAVLVMVYLWRKNLFFLGIASFFMILFHRFVLYPARVTHIDFPAIMFLLAGMMVLTKKPRSGYFLIGVSLAIKQMAIFLVPIFIVYAWHQNRSKKVTILHSLFLLAVSALSLAPFIVNNPIGTMQSIFFSVERAATGDFASPSLSTIVGLTGTHARIPMLGILILVYIAVWRKELRLFGATLAVFVVFAGFNPVLFFQYLAWIIPFIPLAISEVTLSESPLQSSHRLRDT